MAKRMPSEVIPKPPITFDDLETWFEHSFRQTIPFLGGWSPMRGLSGTIRPATDVFDRGGEVVVKVELPGLKREEVEVHLKDDLLIISGEKKMKDEETGDDTYLKREISYGRYQRAMRLPDNVRKDGLKAKFEDGVLTVRIPRSEEPRREAIPIQVQ